VGELIGLGTPVNSSDFSYLRNCDKPKLFVHGANDEHGDVGKLEQLVESLPGENRLVVVAGAEHFFAGKLDQVDAAIRAWVTQRDPEIAEPSF
jgi:alpha/beta superfamily hydrolase